MRYAIRKEFGFFKLYSYASTQHVSFDSKDPAARYALLHMLNGLTMDSGDVSVELGHFDNPNPVKVMLVYRHDELLSLTDGRRISLDEVGQ